MADKCTYSLAWIGPCGKDCHGRFCKKHSAERCVSCGDQATGECPSTGSLVCGAPLCNNCAHDASGHRRVVLTQNHVYTSTDTHQVEFRGKGGIYGSSAMVVPKDEPDHQPAFMAIAPDDLAELQRKAALWDAYEDKRRESLSDCDRWVEDTEQLLSKLKQLRKEIEK